MILDEGGLPPSYLAEVMRLLSMIETAVDTAAVQDVGRNSEGVLGEMEVAKAMRPANIEELHFMIEAAIALRLEYLRS